MLPGGVPTPSLAFCYLRFELKLKEESCDRREIAADLTAFNRCTVGFVGRRVQPDRLIVYIMLAEI